MATMKDLSWPSTGCVVATATAVFTASCMVIECEVTVLASTSGNADDSAILNLSAQRHYVARSVVEVRSLGRNGKTSQGCRRRCRVTSEL
jgi:hypothetical protein